MTRWHRLKQHFPGQTWLRMVSFGLLMGGVFPFYSAHFFGKEAFSPWYVLGCISAGILVGSACFLLYNRYYQQQRKKDEMAHSQLVANEHKMRQLAYQDELTQLPSRCHFYERFSSALEKATSKNHRIALLFLDLDRFKKINDTLGHAIGDQVLKVVAQRLKSFVVPSIKVARFGGDEFVLMVDPADERIVRCLAERICDVVSAPIQHGHFELYVRTSIGISIFPDNGATLDSLIQHADIAMYRAKELGGSRFHFFCDEMAAHAKTLLQLEGHLHRALELDELHLEYQPQLDLRSGQIVGVEALLRWNHPKMGRVRPDLFIPVAEETGLIVSIGAWVIQTACHQAAEWLAAGHRMVMSINLSARQLSDPQCVRLVAQTLKETGLPPELLTLEITESLMVEDDAEALGMLKELRALGIGIALDDFGTGYSSLNYLQQMPITSLKIDRSNVVAAETDTTSAAILQTVVELADRLSLKVVAEGVETASQVEMLRAYNSHCIQGFWFSRPLKPKALEALLTSDRDPFSEIVFAASAQPAI